MSIRSSIHHSYDTGKKQEHPGDFYSTVSSKLVRLFGPYLALSVIVTATNCKCKSIQASVKILCVSMFSGGLLAYV